MARLLAATALMWILMLGLSVVPSVRSSEPVFVALMYAANGSVCHQRPERSFHTGESQWPVCARCSGLYLAAPLGALLAFVTAGGLSRRRSVITLTMFGAPTTISFAAEHLAGLPVGNPARFVAALPLGAAIAWIIVS